MPKNSDIEYSATQHINLLMRRVVMLMLAAGALAVLAIWAMEVDDGTLDRYNRIGYPCLVLIFLGSLFVLWRHRRALAWVRWIGFVCFTGMLLLGLWTQVHVPAPMVANYNAVTLLNWLPLCYAIAFFMLETRQAFLAAAGILVFFGACTYLRGEADTAYAAQDRALLLNTLISHSVLVVCLTGLLWLKHVVTVQGEQATRLDLLAATDPLTGLANRRRTLQQLDEVAREARIELGPVVLLADLDYFKRINDKHGHDVGDQALVAVAEALRAGTREVDTVARWGGEEFLVLLPSTRHGEALELAERLRLRIEALVLHNVDGVPVPLTMSIGVARLCPNETGSAWLRRADEALYDAKGAGRNRCMMARPARTPAK